MENTYLPLGQYVRDLRHKRGLTLHQVAKEVDIDSPMLSKIERGARLPTLEQLRRLSVYYEVREEDLRILHIAENIIRTFGVNVTTYKAIRIVEEQIDTMVLKRVTA